MGSPRHRVWPTGDTQFTCVFFSVLSVWGSPECHLPHYSLSNSEGRAPTRVPVILTSRPLFSHVFGHVVLTECLAVLVLGGSQGREAEGLVRGGASLPSAGPSMADRKVANHGRHLRHRVSGALHPYTFRGSRSVPVTGLGSRHFGAVRKGQEDLHSPIGWRAYDHPRPPR